MNCNLVAYNHHIINKMLWMSRQLRNCNDNVTICNWAHAMSLLKSLLFPLHPITISTYLNSHPRKPLILILLTDLSRLLLLSVSNQQRKSLSFNPHLAAQNSNQ